MRSWWRKPLETSNWPARGLLYRSPQVLVRNAGLEDLVSVMVIIETFRLEWNYSSTGQNASLSMKRIRIRVPLVSLSLEKWLKISCSGDKALNRGKTVGI